MIITKSNILAGVTPTITTGISTDLPQNITDPDFSVFYKSSNANSLIAEFGATALINYVAVAGTNIEGNKDFTSYVAVNDGATEILRISVKNNQPVVLVFADRAFTNLRVTLFNSSGGVNPILKFCAAGNYLTVPNNGEQAGYNRNFLERNFKNRTTLNNQSEPVALVRKRIQAKGKLNIPNTLLAFSEGEWQDFLTFAQESLFFILERPFVLDGGVNKAPAAYLCYELGVNSAKAHGQTRSLNNLSLSFKVYNGL